jgi:cell division protein YceG involved in septum cleavage
MGIYAEFYNFGMDQKTKKPEGTIEYDVVNNADNKVVLSQTEDLTTIPNASSFLVTVEKKLPLSTLAPGKYTLKLKVTDKLKNQSLTPSAQFTVTS